LSFKATSKLLISAGVIAAVAAIWHLLCILGGPSWFAFARAPQQVIESAQQGTLLAPLSTLVVAGLMFTCSAFAFSAARLIRSLPLLKSALITITILCILRALSAIPSLVYANDLDLWQLVASSVWLYTGICFLAGTAAQYKTP